MPQSVAWTVEKLTQLKKEYEGHIAAGKDRNFVFVMTIDGERCEFLMGYAKYLIEYLEGVLGQ